ncbi:hypothetical protein Daus18300_009801 [Diaporthe australafricana]|uniref:chitinase n=1 Tax=Diaporthe australafricana TaxID=127596 RepID=A0ABR3WDL1_9PEZI
MGAAAPKRANVASGKRIVGDEFCIGTSATNVCQQGFGTCGTVSPPACSGRSAYGRTLGYYQVSNVRDRQCNRITPAQIVTTGLTHLYAAFATIDPNLLTIAPANAADVDIYKQMTALKTSTLQVWIAVGGWDFNDPGPTRTTFSDLSATAARRSRFINSVISFMDQHGFQGVDLDWEYPGAPDRGGKLQDIDNFVTLVREMRAAFGTKYGISLTLPASYWYLRWFKPKEMEPYVDFFGLMTYDLHGPWDESVSQTGKVVLGQTNIPEIYNWTQPLWYAGVDPAKINFGLAYYGRGYTLADQSCNTIGCAWSGASRAAPCTNFGGVMSLQELQRLPSEIGVQPQLLAKDMMKQLTWGNQWIGYDDDDTIRMKKNWASQQCYGGTMIWSVDLYSGSGSGDVPDGGGSTDPGNPGGGQGGAGSNIVYIDPSIWTQGSPTINCRPPCSFVLPPLQLSTKTTIKFPPYVTSLDVAWSEPTGWTSTVQTTTLTIPPVTTDQIEVWGHSISDTRSSQGVWETFYVTPSIRPSPFTIINDPNPLSSPGVSHPPVTRTITPPPYPYTYTPSEGTKPTSTSSSTDIIPILPFFPIPTYKPGSPGPLCKSKCGKPCLIFCDHPCLLDCSDGGGNDFADPKNPSPPPKPKPISPPDSPRPTAKPNPNPPPSGTDPKMDDPEDPEEEEEDRQCALEFDLPVPKYTGPIGKPSTSSTSIATPPPAPSPSPPPKPDPPKPDRNTESVHCYNSGKKASRTYMIDALTSFCNAASGYTFDDSVDGSTKTFDLGGSDCKDCTLFIYMSITVKNGCRFKVEGPGNNQNCGRILRRIIDECDTSSTEGKQGGTVDDNCSTWRIDPNSS